MMTKLPSALSVSILSVFLGEDTSNVRCCIYLASQSVTVPVPSEPIHFREVDLRTHDVMLITVSENSLEIGQITIKLARVLSSEREINSEYQIARSALNNRDQVQAVLTAGKIHVRIEAIDSQQTSNDEDYSEYCSEIIEKYTEFESDLKISDTVETYQENHTLLSTMKSLEETKEQLAREQSVNKQMTQINRRQNTKLKSFKNAINSLNSQIKHYKEALEMNENCRKLLEESWKQRDELKHDFSILLNEMTGRNQIYEETIENVQKENKELIERIKILEQDVDKYKDENMSIKASQLKINTENYSLKAKILGLNDEISRFKDIEHLLKETEKSYKSLENNLEVYRKSSSIDFDRLSQNIEKLLVENKAFTDEIESLNRKLSEKEKEIIKLKTEKEKLNLNSIKLQESFLIEKDLKEELTSENSSLKDSHIILIKELEVLREKINKKDETIEETNTEIEKARSKIHTLELDLEEKNKAFNKILVEKRIYCPDLKDPIDIAIADYINTADPSFKIPIIREDIGIYMFGAKKVFVKLENGKLIFRVGGGFMQIEDLIDIYSPEDNEKLKGNTQMVRKTVYGKIAERNLVDHCESPELNSNHATFYTTQKRSISPYRSVSPPRKRKQKYLRHKAKYND